MAVELYTLHLTEEICRLWHFKYWQHCLLGLWDREYNFSVLISFIYV